MLIASVRQGRRRRPEAEDDQEFRPGMIRRIGAGSDPRRNRLSVGADRGGRHDHHRRGVPRRHHAAQHAQQQGLRARLRRAHRQASVDLPHHSRRRASSATTPGSNGSAEYTGNTGVWTQITVDTELGLAYLPVEIADRRFLRRPSPGQRSVTATAWWRRSEDRQAKWYYQLVHHAFWDMDISSAPLLMDITVDGKPIKAVAQPTSRDSSMCSTASPASRSGRSKSAGGEGQRARRMVCADPAVPDQAARLQPQRRLDRTI